MNWSHQLTPLPVALPLLVAALLAGMGGFLPRRLFDLIGIITCLVIFLICCALVHSSAHNTIIYMRPFRKLQSGNVGDYIAWFGLGIAGYCGALIFFSR